MKILVATDGTEHSNAVIDFVSEFELREGDEVLVVSVVDLAVPISFDVYTGYIPDNSELEAAVRENAESVLKETKATITGKLKVGNVAVSTDILVGSPESEIVEKAEQMKANLIIVGSHGYNRWERLLLGSVSDSVVHHAPCSVLVVRS